MAKKPKKAGKRMAMGGVAAMEPRRSAPLSRRDMKNAVARPMPSARPGMVMRPPVARPNPPMAPEVMPGVDPSMMRGRMRGGGLAKKGVGMALAKGGMVKGAGCAKRGVKKAQYP